MSPCKFAFAISKYKKDWDLGPCINLELANECRCTVATFDKFGGKLATHFLIRSRNHAASCQREPLLRGNINQESWYWPLLRWGDGRWGKNNKNKKTSLLFGTQYKARAGWPPRLRLVRAAPWADFAVITAQLWSSTTAIFSWVNNLAFNCYLQPRSWDYCQIFKKTDLFLLNAGVFPFSLSEMFWHTCTSEYLHKDSNLEVSSNREYFFRNLTQPQF